MILGRSILKSEMTKGPTSIQSLLRPQKSKTQRSMMFPIALTSLIDAFSILVIFLLIQGPSGQKELNLGKKILLPSAQALTPMDQGVSVRIENGRYYVEDKEVSTAQLVRRLHDIRQKMIDEKVEDNKSLIVQADKRSDFQMINPIIQAGAQTGFEQIKFAVLPWRGS